MLMRQFWKKAFDFLPKENTYMAFSEIGLNKNDDTISIFQTITPFFMEILLLILPGSGMVQFSIYLSNPR